jgi:hypothetical protein
LPNCEYTREQVLALLGSTHRDKQEEGLLACLSYSGADAVIDGYCRHFLDAGPYMTQLMAAWAAAARGLVDIVDPIAARMASDDWEVRLDYGVCLESLLQRAPDERLFEIATSDYSLLAYMACIILIRRGTDRELIYSLHDELSARPEVLRAMRVPSPEIQERWHKITQTST